MALTSVILNRVLRSSSSGPSTKRVDNGSYHNPSGVCVNSADLTPRGMVRPLDRPSVTALVAKKSENTTKKLRSADHDMLIRTFLTKYPHYRFVDKVRHTNQQITKYWLLDTSRNVTVIFSKDDVIGHLKNAQLGRPSLSALAPIEEKQIEAFVPTKIPPTRYQQYLLNKYGTIKPFPKVFLPGFFVDDFKYEEPDSYAGLEQSKRFHYKK